LDTLAEMDLPIRAMQPDQRVTWPALVAVKLGGGFLRVGMWPLAGMLGEMPRLLGLSP